MSSKPEFTTVEKIPEWAVTVIVNADESGMEESDLIMLDKYIKFLRKQGLILVEPIEGTEQFSPHPAFGLACNTVDFTAEVVTKIDDPRCFDYKACKDAVYDPEIRGAFGWTEEDDKGLPLPHPMLLQSGTDCDGEWGLSIWSGDNLANRLGYEHGEIVVKERNEDGHITDAVLIARGWKGEW